MSKEIDDPGVLSRDFVLIATANFFLFLILSCWSFLPVFIVGVGGNRADVGLVMGSIGITSLGSLPIIAPLMDRYGRQPFMLWGVVSAGVSNLGFALFDVYSPTMIGVRLAQGIAFASCFNACSAAVVDIVPRRRRVQGLGLFGAAGSLAVAVGPFIAELVIIAYGFTGYFALLTGFGVAGGFVCLLFKESFHSTVTRFGPGAFFSTARQGRFLGKMALAVSFGAGFAAMQTFFPLFAAHLTLRVGPFFVAYGLSLLAVRVLLGSRLDRLSRPLVTLTCLVGYALMLTATPLVAQPSHILALGGLFGCLQGIAYPTMMATMVDEAAKDSRGVVVALFTGAFGVGINLSLPLWGAVAEKWGIPAVYYTCGATLFCAACLYGGRRVLLRATSEAPRN